MKIFCISDEIDIKDGMRLVGIEGVVLKNKQEIEKFIDDITKNTEIAILLITENISKLCQDKIIKIKTTKKFPIITSIPNQNGQSDISSNIKKYINESIGIKI
jgi:V/A-type H+-transporting ATPase subunit F